MASTTTTTTTSNPLLDFLASALNALVYLQAELLSWMAPAQLLVGRLLKKNRAHAVWTVRFAASSPLFGAPPRLDKHSAAILEVLKGIEKHNPQFHALHAAVGPGGGDQGVFEALYVSPTFKWVDKVELKLLSTASKCNV